MWFPGKRFRCGEDGCDKVFRNMRGLAYHWRSHNKPMRYYRCKRCGFRNPDKVLVDVHRVAFHNHHRSRHRKNNLVGAKGSSSWAHLHNNSSRRSADRASCSDFHRKVGFGECKIYEDRNNNTENIPNVNKNKGKSNTSVRMAGNVKSIMHSQTDTAAPTESDDMGVRLVVFLGLLFSTCAEPESGTWVWKRLWQPHLDGICSALCPQDEATPCPTTPPEPTPPSPPEPTDYCRKNPKTLACQLVLRDPELAVRLYKENQWAFLREGARHKEETPTDQDVVVSEEQEQEQVRDEEDRAGARKKIREWKQVWGSDQDSDESEGQMTYGQRRYTSWSSRSIVTARPDASVVGDSAVIRSQYRPVTVKMNMNLRRGQVMRSFRTHRREGETQAGGEVRQQGGELDTVFATRRSAWRLGLTVMSAQVWRRREVRRRQTRQAVLAGACRSQGKVTTPRRVRVDGRWQDFELYSFQVGRSVFQRFYAVSCADSKPVTNCDCGGFCQNKYSQFAALEIYKDDNDEIKVRPRLVEVPTCCELVIPS
ncbi:Hypp1010 [Branchiostoma lanceolatum]|uniref:Hypp1010 protein n=1 Tax=Branchiostoma lanceolatum TaxID=7740 RepID=A0A8K0EGY3_BRALA|nr:Hypp1010 [Branchiostoma lanceolatum]